MAICMPAAAQEPADSTAAEQLDEVVVEARMQRTSATVSTYIPTRRQKNASQTGPDLLGRMGLPQLGLVSGNNVTTVAGRSVALFIDYVPASEQELSGMRMADVRKVEYYDYPQDPRFQGKAHVVNFVMQSYDYGGYVKAYANEFFRVSSGQLNLYSKLQYKKMTYDLALGGWYCANDHFCQSAVETFRLPQPDGPVKVFERISEPTGACTRQRSLWPTFKATYSTGNVTMVNTLGGNFFFSPKQNTAGSVVFVPADFPSTEYTDTRDTRTNSVTYSGYWNFTLPHGNSINFNPYYSYSHTRQHSLYAEQGGPSLRNDARDDSHRATASLRFVHDFGTAGNITVICNAFFNASRTRYAGTSDASDRLVTLRLGPGLFYNYKNERFNGLVGGGFNYDHSRFGDTRDHSTQPWVDASLQYSFNDRNSVNLEFHHATWAVPSSDRSTAVIRSNPLFSYTGNPELRPYKSFDVSLRYVWMPDNRLSFSAFGAGWADKDRYAYVYEASATGVLRTIRQNVGGYSQWRYGLGGTARLFGRKLMLNAQVSHRIVHDGAPFGWTRQGVAWYAQAFYYLDGWNFGVQYQSRQMGSEGAMTGVWTTDRSAYAVIAGWGNSAWSIEGRLTNPFRQGRRTGTAETVSAAYDVRRTFYNHGCFIILSGSYTFGFGKKVQRGNEASQQTGTSSGILK